MLKLFCHEMERLARQPANCHFLLTVSGGADSVVMTDLFHRADYSFTIAHCNFHLRGEDSNQDMRLVMDMADNLKVPLLIKEFDTFGVQKNSGLSIEMVARDLRYQWFNEIGRDFDYIVTAHQANDAAETMLLNLCRGTGLHGLTSIPERNGKIIRPMLIFTAKEIRDYAHEHNIPYAIDCTNSDEKYKRNRIRGSVIPLLETLNPDLIHTLTRDRQIFCQQWAFLHAQMDEYRKTLLKNEGDHFSINLAKLKQEPFNSLILFELLQKFDFSAATIQQIENCESLQTGKEFLSDTHRLLVDRNRYLIYPLEKQQIKEKIINSIEELSQFFKVELLHNDGKINFPKDNKTLFLDENRLKFPVTLRTWRHGDYFYPLGGTGKQKLSDFFIDHKINKIAKEQIPLFCIDNVIVWIIGHRSDERYKIHPQHTSKYYKISYNEHV